MKKITFLILSVLAISCTTKSQKMEKADIYEQILSLKGKTKSDVISLFGNPQKIDKNQEGDEALTYAVHSNYFDVLLDSKNKVQSVSLAHWKKGFDNYLFLKKRFHGYKWEEKELPPIKAHYVNEPYEVKIPELGIEFEYDNQDPQRRPMFIWFKLN